MHDSDSLAIRRVAITGLGLITSLGTNVPTTWQRVLAGETGIQRVPDLDPERFGCVLRGDVDDTHLPSQFLSGKPARTTSRFARMAVEATGEALRSADLVSDSGEVHADAELELGGSVFGTCLGGTYDDLLPAYEQFLARGPGRVSPHLHVMFPHNLAAYAVQTRFGMGGPSGTVVTACATGAQAIGEAFMAIRTGQAPVMVAGAVESQQNPFFIAGFAAMRALVTDSNDEPEAASRPFDASRAGFVLGEGAGVLILEEWERAVRRGAPILAEVVGYATSNDAYHPIAPLPNGSGAARAIRDALRVAGLAPSAVDHINAHAASTPAGDLAEAVAIAEVYGDHTESVAVTSVKSAFGHCMGASGAIETVISVLSLRDGCVPPTRNYRTPDPGFPRRLDVVAGEARQADVRVVAKHAFGLGGQNACLILRRPDQSEGIESTSLLHTQAVRMSG